MRNSFGLMALLALAGCIPPGDGTRMPTPEASAPQLKTETDALGETGPAPWLSRPVEANALTVAESVYTVQPGDTLRGIANKTGAGSQILAMTNGLVPPYVIQPGQQLRVTGGRYHRVAEGETGIAIARAYGADWGDMVTLNGLEAPYVLRVGQNLLLPAAAPTNLDRLSLEQRASAFRLDIDDIVTGGEPASLSEASALAMNPAQGFAGPTSFDGRFFWPVQGKILSRFGGQGEGKVNDGINIAAVKGAPVLASAAGTVAYAGDEIGVFGGLVLINHGNGWVTAYGHTENIAVKRGDRVSAGQVIARAGDSGYVSEPQLHFEIRRDRKPVDPALYLAK